MKNDQDANNEQAATEIVKDANKGNAIPPVDVASDESVTKTPSPTIDNKATNADVVLEKSQHEKAKVEEIATKSTASARKSKKSSVIARKTKLSKLAVLCLLLIAVFSLVTGYGYTLLQQRSVDNENVINQLQSTLSQDISRLQSLNSEQYAQQKNENQHQLDALTGKIEQQQQAIDSLLQRQQQ